MLEEINMERKVIAKLTKKEIEEIKDIESQREGIQNIVNNLVITSGRLRRQECHFWHEMEKKYKLSHDELQKIDTKTSEIYVDIDDK